MSRDGGRDGSDHDGAAGRRARAGTGGSGRGRSTTQRGRCRVAAAVLAALVVVAAATVGVGGVAATATGPVGGSTAPGAVAGDAPDAPVPGTTGVDGDVAADADGNVSTEATTITGCTEITSAGTYEVQSFEADTLSACLLVNTTGLVTLEGAGVGATVEGNGGGIALGITADSPATVAIEDVRFRTWGDAVQVAAGGDAFVTGLDAVDVGTGVEARGAESVTILDASVTDASFLAVDAAPRDTLVVDGLEVYGADRGLYVSDIYGRSRATVDDVDATNVRDTAVQILGDAPVDVDGVAVDNASTGVSIADAPTGTVRDVTVADTPVAVRAGGDASGVRFEDVDYGADSIYRTDTVEEVSFRVANASVGRVASTPTPRIPDGVGNGTGPVRVVPNDGATEWVVDYDGVVAEPFEDDLVVAEFQRGQWGGPVGSVNGTAETVRFTPTEESILGVFHGRSPVASCAEFDAPGDYEVESIAGAGGDCLRVTHSDVTLSGGGATLSGTGGDAVAVSPGVEGVVVGNLTTDGWTHGLNVTGVTEATLTGLTVTNASGDGIDAEGADGVVVFDTTVRGATGYGLNGYDAGYLRASGLRVADVASSGGFLPTPGTGVYLGGSPGSSHELSVSRVRVENASRGVVVDDSAFGTVADVTGRDVARTVEVPGSGATAVDFERVDTGTGTASFAASRAAVGPAPAVDPPTPGARSNATGHLNVTALGSGGYVDVDYGASVPEAYEDSVFAGPYDPTAGAWRDTAPVDAPNETVRFAPGDDASATYGVFADRAPLTSCGVLDAPGVYAVESFDGDVAALEACLSIRADDVTLRGTPGATVTGNGSGVGIQVGSRVSVENVTVRDVNVTGYFAGVESDEGAAFVVDDVRVSDAVVGVNVALDSSDRLTVRDATVTGTTVYGVRVDGDFGGRASLRDVAVRDAQGYGVIGTSLTELDAEGVAVANVSNTTDPRSGSPLLGSGVVLVGGTGADVRDVAVRDTRRGVWLFNAASGRVSNVTTTGVAEAVNATLNATGTTVEDLSTPAGPATVVEPESVTVSPANATGSPADRPVALGAVAVAGTSDDAAVDLRFGFDAGVDAANVSVYEYDPARAAWFDAGGVVDATNRTVTAPVSPATGSASVYGAFGSGDAATTCPKVESARATDPDTDGRCEDVDGSGTFGFLDVVALLFADPATLTAAEAAAFDFDGSGTFGFLDVVDLLFRL